MTNVASYTIDHLHKHVWHFATPLDEKFFGMRCFPDSISVTVGQELAVVQSVWEYLGPSLVTGHIDHSVLRHFDRTNFAGEPPIINVDLDHHLLIWRLLSYSFLCQLCEATSSFKSQTHVQKR